MRPSGGQVFPSRTQGAYLRARVCRYSRARLLPRAARLLCGAFGPSRGSMRPASPAPKACSAARLPTPEGEGRSGVPPLSSSTRQCRYLIPPQQSKRVQSQRAWAAGSLWRSANAKDKAARRRFYFPDNCKGACPLLYPADGPAITSYASTQRSKTHGCRGAELGGSHAPAAYPREGLFWLGGVAGTLRLLQSVSHLQKAQTAPCAQQKLRA